MSNKPGVLALDGTNLMHRAYHAMLSTDMRNSAGEAVWALQGFARLTAKYVEAVNPRWLVLTFDMQGSSDPRKLLDPGYKGGRGESDADLISQLVAAPALFAKAGLSVMVIPEREADDSLAAIAKRSEEAGVNCHIVSADRDALRLISPTVTIMHPDGRFLDDAYVMEKYGVHAKRYPEMAALVGESSDNLPGARGIGPKNAAKIISGCDDIIELLDSPERAKAVAGDRFGKILIEYADRVKLNLKIATPMVDMDPNPFIKAGELPIDGAKIEAAMREAQLPSSATALVNALGATKSSTVTFY